MKKRLRKAWGILIPLALLAALSLLCFAACSGSGDKGETHTHVWAQYAGTSCLKSMADCTHPAVYYVSCTVCYELGDETFTPDGEVPLGHIGGETSCRERAVCVRCGEAYGELGPHNLSSTSVIVEPTCTQPGSKTTECLDCGAKVAETIPASHKGEWLETAAPRCFDDGEKQRVCTACGALETEKIPMYGAHAFAGSTCTGGDKCRRCHYIEGDGLGHDFGDFETTEDATCTAVGKRVAHCSRCSAVKEETIPMIGHEWKTEIVTPSTCRTRGEGRNTCTHCHARETVSLPLSPHSGEWMATVAATCSTAGKEERICTECGAAETRPIAKLPHAYNAWITEKWEDCTENGLQSHVCTTCQYKETKVIPASHYYPDEWTTVKEPTCSETGTLTKTCMREGCGHVLTATLPKKPHTFDNWRAAMAPSCTTDGRDERICAVCRHMEERVVPKRGHVYEGGDCTTPAVCKVCGVTSGFGHTFGEWRVIEDPDCGRCGYSMRTCTRCEETETEQSAPLGHTFDTSSVFREPTCSTCGILRKTCSVCGKIEEEDIETTDHAYGAWQNDPDHAATCTAGGKRFRLCTVCGHRQEEDTSALGHNFPEGTCYTEHQCTRCDVREKGHVFTDDGCSRCGAKFTSDATFVLSADKTYYIMTCIGTIPDGVAQIIIRPVYNDLPVKAITIDTEYQNKERAAVAIIIPEGVEEISNDAFRSFVNLTAVVIPDSVTYIGNNAFRGCTSLASIRIPGGVKSIGKAAFFGCTQLAGVEMLDGIAEIQMDAFSECSALTSLRMPETLTTIASGAFSRCTSLTAIHIPGSVKTIGFEAFSGCQSLATVTLSDGIETIGSRAFANTAITGILLPGSLKNLEAYVFFNCKSLESVVIPSGVETIVPGAFSECTALARVTFQNPDGWQVSEDYQMTGAISLPAADLRDPTTAAQALKGYVEYYWKRT